MAVVSQYGYHSAGAERMAGPAAVAAVKKGRKEFYEDEYDDDEVIGGGSSGGKKARREGFDGYGYGAGGKVGLAGALG